MVAAPAGLPYEGSGLWARSSNFPGGCPFVLFILAIIMSITTDQMFGVAAQRQKERLRTQGSAPLSVGK